MSAPDLTSYHAVHAALRLTPHRLAGAARTIDPHDHRRAKALGRYWRGFAGEVLAHHTIEDDHFFPALVERVPVAAAMIERTDDEHHRLDELMAACADAVDRLEHGSAVASSELVGCFEALATHMDHHLDFEDADILPLFERHFTADEYSVLEDAAMKSLGIGAQAAFTVPFIAGSVDPDTRERLFGTAPAAFRLLYRATRRRHTRLDARVFGSVRSASADEAVAA